MWIGDLDTRGAAAQAAREAPPAAPGPPRQVDALLDALALRFTDGYAAAAPVVTRALELDLALEARSEEARRWLWSTAGNAGGILATELWDFASWDTLTARNVQVAREAGALMQLRHALQFPVTVSIHKGDLATAARLIEEEYVIAGVAGPSSLAIMPMILASWRGDEAQGERTSVTPTDWVTGIEARVRAFLSDGDAADRWYRESIERLGRTEVRAQLARSHLLYGEWLLCCTESGCAARTAGARPAISSAPPTRC